MAKKPLSKSKREKQQVRIEDKYRKFFAAPSRPVPSDDLRQPSIYKEVETFTTYGAYEEPI